MMQYLIILLDDTSVSFCHYANPKTERRLIGLNELKAALLLAMKQNWRVQLVYPDYEIPQAYRDAIDTIESNKIAPVGLPTGDADVVVVDGLVQIAALDWLPCTEKILVVRTAKAELFADGEKLAALLGKVARVNVVLTDVDTFTDVDFAQYGKLLEQLKDAVKAACTGGVLPQCNLLTDRIALDKMNSCNAGCANITLAPNGKFYVCPAFYYDSENDSVGDLSGGLNIPNPQLYQLACAPLCRHCDAYQCKRCTWLNRKTTREVNTPSHEQCVAAHLERNISRQLLLEIQAAGGLPEKEIKEIEYLDPFEVKEQFN